jgi:hypothetical protein
MDDQQPFMLVVRAADLALGQLDACVAVAAELVVKMPKATIWWFNDLNVHSSVSTSIDSFFRSCIGLRHVVRLDDFPGESNGSMLSKCELFKSVLRGGQDLPPELTSEYSIIARVSPHTEEEDTEKRVKFDLRSPCWQPYASDTSHGLSDSDTCHTSHVVVGGTGMYFSNEYHI